MKKIVLVFIFFVSIMNGQELKVYQLYNSKGKKIAFDKLIEELKTYDIVLFGELHDNAVNHWLQLQVTKELYKIKGNDLILGAEMFERHQQEGLSKYIENKTTENEFLTSTKLWSNYKTDYKLLVEFAKTNHLKFITTNVTRKYASSVAKYGLESLDTISDSEKSLFVKLPFPVDYNAPGYPEMMKMMGDHSGAKAKQFVAAQAIKDATMAESILNNFSHNKLFLHFNGDYHSKNFGGIYWYLQFYQKNLKIAILQIIESDEKLSVNASELENNSKSQFFIVFPKDYPKSY